MLQAPSGGPSVFLQRVPRQPFVVVLVAEIERAASEVHAMLLRLLDEGRFTDRIGRTARFRNAVIIMTSNVGAQRAATVEFQDEAPHPYQRAMLQAFRPASVNRLDTVVTLQPWNADVVLRLAERELGQHARREGPAKSSWELTWDECVAPWPARDRCAPRDGARPSHKLVEPSIVAPVARWLLANAPLVGSVIRRGLVDE